MLSFYKQSNPPNKIICIGTICLDIVQTCQQFPLEDTMGRSVDYRWQRGGNASNTCTVLSLLKQPCEILARFGGDFMGHKSFLRDDLRKYKIDHFHCPTCSLSSDSPVSTIILSLSTGSRTIIHHKANLSDLMLSDFEALSLPKYSWIHFEGRNLDQVLPMIRSIQNYNNSLSRTRDQSADDLMPITVSVELERTRPELLGLLPYADVVFVAKDFARSQGLNSMEEVMQKFDRGDKTGAIVICAWAEEGAMARTTDGAIVQSPAFPPPHVIDTLGAGDTFNGAALYYLNRCKLKFVNERKEETPRADDNNKIERERDNSTAIKRDTEQNSNVKTVELKAGKDRTQFIDETVLQKAITFACRIAGAKVGLRGYDGLGEVCTDILLNYTTDQ